MSIPVITSIEKNVELAKEFAKTVWKTFPNFGKPIICDDVGVYVLYVEPFQIIKKENIFSLNRKNKNEPSHIDDLESVETFIDGCRWISDYEGNILPEDYQPYGIIENSDSNRKPINPDA